MLLKKAVNQQAFLKAGVFGFAGSGKTYTASLLAMGIAKRLGNSKPVAFMDTESGSDYLIKKFEKENIELLVIKSRSFVDLIATIKEAEQSCSVLIIDSISHVWRDLMDSYATKMNRKRLTFGDWAVLKKEWSQFSDLFLNSKIHIIMCGRAGYEYEYFKDVDGKMELTKSNTKMKVETEMGYEPSLLFEMEKARDKDDKFWVNKMYVLKDRTDTINGQEFDNPTYETFLPILNFLNIGGEHFAVDTSRNSVDMFNDSDKSWIERAKQVEICLEEIQEQLILKGLDGTSKEAKEQRTKLMIDVFGSSSKTLIEGLSLEKLKEGLEKIKTYGKE